MWLYFIMFWGGLFWLGLASNQPEHPKNDLEHTKNHTVIPWQPNTAYFLYNSALKKTLKIDKNSGTAFLDNVLKLS